MSPTSVIHDKTPATTAPSLDTARLYLCTDAREKQGDFADFLRAAYAGGVDIIQLRDKSLEAAAELELLAVLKSVAQEYGKLWSVNDRADVALLSGAPVFHVGQKDLPLPAARSLVGAASSIGLSCHDSAQASAAAANPDADYFCVGPVWATPTKPGRAAVGLSLVEHAASLETAKPWCCRSLSHSGGTGHYRCRRSDGGRGGTALPPPCAGVAEGQRGLAARFSKPLVQLPHSGQLCATEPPAASTSSAPPDRPFPRAAAL